MCIYNSYKPSCFDCTHSNYSFGQAEGTTAAILGLILRLVVAQGVVLQHHPTVLPSMDVICPLENIFFKTVIKLGYHRTGFICEKGYLTKDVQKLVETAQLYHSTPGMEWLISGDLEEIKLYDSFKCRSKI